MPDPLAVLSMRRFKAQLLARDAEQMRIMARQWTGVERQLDAHISALAREIDEKRRNGEIVSQTRLYQLQRYKSLKAQTEEEFSRYANWATTEVTEQQRALAKLGLDHGARAIGDVYAQHGMVGTFDRLPVQAAENMAGLAGDGRPVGVLLKNRINPHYSDERALSAWTNLTDTLVRNTALGINPRETAEAMRDDLAGGLQKGLTIARTEQLRVYRQANQQQYEESGVVSGHKRLCDHTDRTCIACLADEGTLYPVTEPIFDHPAGRCTSVPVVKGLPELQFETGEEWLETLDEDEQRKIMGNERYEAWKDGTPIKEFITYTDHPIWGPGLTPTPVSKLSAVPKRGVADWPSVEQAATMSDNALMEVMQELGGDAPEQYAYMVEQTAKLNKQFGKQMFDPATYPYKTVMAQNKVDLAALGKNLPTSPAATTAPAAPTSTIAERYGQNLTFADMDEAYEWTKDNFADVASKLTESQYKSIQDYCGFEYADVNYALRGETGLQGPGGKIVRDLDNVLAKSTTPDDLVVYRGAGNVRSAEGNIIDWERLTGMEYTDPAYTSAALVPGGAELHFESTFFEINVPAGSRGMSVMDVSGYVEEAEFLLPRGSTFSITAVEKQGGKTLVKMDLRG